VILAGRRINDGMGKYVAAEIDKARTLLGYAPEFNVRHGLAKAAKWYFENLPR